MVKDVHERKILRFSHFLLGLVKSLYVSPRVGIFGGKQRIWKKGPDLALTQTEIVPLVTLSMPEICGGLLKKSDTTLKQA